MALALVFAGCGGAGANGGSEDPSSDESAPPEAPGGLEAESEDGAVALSWETVGADDLEGYYVYRGTTSLNEVSNRDPITESSISDVSYVDDAAENGTKYYYRVTAVDEDDNESDPSSEATATPFSNPPERP